MDHREFPDIPKDLLDHLDRIFPERSASPGQSLAEVMFDAGRRSVIRTLLHVYGEQNQTVLTPEELLYVQA